MKSEREKKKCFFFLLSFFPLTMRMLILSVLTFAMHPVVGERTTVNLFSFEI